MSLTEFNGKSLNRLGAVIDYRVRNGARAVRSWGVPFVQSQLHPGEFRPILSYLFTEFRCNMRCRYCFTYDNDIEGMSFETARRSIDWLKTTGCRVVAIMGGEPLLRKEFITDVVRYGTSQGFFMYLPTNGALLDEAAIDAVGSAGVAAVNVAIDCIDPKPGMPKALSRVEKNLQTLIRRETEHGYLVFINVNLTSENLGDIKELASYAAANQVGIDFHVNERPVFDLASDRSRDCSIRPDQVDEAEELLDWLIERNGLTIPTVNSKPHLEAMKRFIRGELQPWGCRAGQSSLAIKIDGSLSPCFGRYLAGEDWGTIGAIRFDKDRLDSIKRRCSTRCLSTCQFNLHHFSSFSTIHGWIQRHSIIGRAPR